MQSAILAIPNILADISGCKNITVHPRWSSGRCCKGLMRGGVGTQTRLTVTINGPLFSDVGVSDRADD